MRLAEHVERVAEMKNTPKILVGNPERKMPLERCRHIEMDLTATG
jgi:hypothetical protein